MANEILHRAAIGVTFTLEELKFIRRLDPEGGWRQFSIVRSGTAKRDQPVRQRLRRKGLVETHPDRTRRRMWRLTKAGQQALRLQTERTTNA